MPNYNDILFAAFQPYLHSGLWLLVMAIMVGIGVWLFQLAWHKRQDEGGLFYPLAISACIPLLGAYGVYAIQNVNLWQGLVAIFLSVAVVTGPMPKRRRRPRRSVRY